MWRDLVTGLGGIAITIIAFLGFPEYHSFFEKHLVNIILAATAVAGVMYAHFSYVQQKRLSPAQNRPYIDCRPAAISYTTGKKKYAGTHFNVVNHSGFDAKNIGIDLKYGGRNWIGQWLGADENRKKKGEDRTETTNDTVQHHSTYRVLIRGLKAHEQTTSLINGTLNVESEVCDKGSEGLPVMVRTIWQNEFNLTFDEIREYRLVCTVVGEGRQYTFLPEAVFSD